MTYHKPRKPPVASRGGGFTAMTTVHIERALGRLEGKMDEVLKGQDIMRTLVSAHSGRLSKLEKWQAWVVGVSAGVGAIVAFALRYIGV